MNNISKIESLLLIKKELEQWLAYQPPWYMQLHGCGGANIAYQRCKSLIQYELQVQAMEELTDSSQSMDLYNLQ